MIALKPVCILSRAAHLALSQQKGKMSLQVTQVLYLLYIRSPLNPSAAGKQGCQRKMISSFLQSCSAWIAEAGLPPTPSHPIQQAAAGSTCENKKPSSFFILLWKVKATNGKQLAGISSARVTTQMGAYKSVQRKNLSGAHSGVLCQGNTQGLTDRFLAEISRSMWRTLSLGPMR